MAMLSSSLETACGFRNPSKRHVKHTDSVSTVFTGFYMATWGTVLKGRRIRKAEYTALDLKMPAYVK